MSDAYLLICAYLAADPALFWIYWSLAIQLPGKEN